jgi:hypothetical protein
LLTLAEVVAVQFLRQALVAQVVEAQQEQQELQTQAVEVAVLILQHQEPQAVQALSFFATHHITETQFTQLLPRQIVPMHNGRYLPLHHQARYPSDINKE